ncbi:N-acetylmuramoyl-L-alanine amidase [Sphingobium sp. DEHP117]|uniref:N-acetylmuramoyl-L-alanine amidase family protein n=1 Tax=Sphingobium sp. DEHP117 TaxID=2993436 RepID=UPI0027D96DB7|nr:N-acetylmuramoyl-L-alanine amidase [Sphingobium sp. DEHP117]
MSAHLLLAPLLFATVGGVHPAEPVWYARPPRHSHSIRVRIPPPAKGVKLPPIYGPTDPSRPLVVIDAGHGGHDPGAASRGGERQEKELTLALALALRDRLVRGGRIRVALTRGDDQFLLLQERYDIARRLGADLFISIHADAAENDTAQGATIYTLSETASDREAARLAARENRSDIINGVDMGAQGGVVNSILIDLSQREAMAQSVAFAELLYREAAAHTPFRSNWHRFASLVVLKAPDVPSILFEAGYITSPQDVARLSSAQGRAQTAEGVARAIEIYFARRVSPR